MNALKFLALISCTAFLGQLAHCSENHATYPQPFAPYFSQCGQDKYLVEEFFKGKRNGVFFDIGAHDGISYSNTYYFEKQLDWTGICVEPQKENFGNLSKNRNCICVHGCIFEHSGEKSFLKVNGPAEMLSGLWETYDPRHLQRARTEVMQRGGSIELMKTHAYNFNELCSTHGIEHIDVLSIDTEGSEEIILKSINYKTVDISVIVVENNYESTSIKNFLKTKGYELHKRIGYTDEIYVKTNDIDDVGQAALTTDGMDSPPIQYYCIPSDDRHFPHLKNLIGSIHHYNYAHVGEIAVFDLGLTPSQRQELETIEKVALHDVEPVHPDLLKKFKTDLEGRHVRGNFAWKPVIIKQALDHYPYVLYSDAGTTILNDLTPLFDYIQRQGYFLLSCSNNQNCNIVNRITSYVRQRLVNSLSEQEQKHIMDQDTIMIDAGFQGLSRTMLTSYVLPAYGFSRNMNYFLDDGSAQRGFGAGRHDQTLYSILAHSLHLTIHPEGFFDLETSRGIFKAHAHWEKNALNKQSIIYRSRWDLDYNGGHTQFIVYKKNPIPTENPSVFHYRNFLESVTSSAVHNLNCEELAQSEQWKTYQELYENSTQKKLTFTDQPRIPKKIHQIWLGSPLPEEFRSLCESWKKVHPDWEYRLWTDKDIEAFDLENRDLYEAAQNFGERSDIARVEILYRLGGLYVDTDFESIKPMDILHHMFDFYTGYPGWCEPILANGLMAATPGHPIMRAYIDQLKLSAESDDLFKRSGPRLFTDCFMAVAPKISEKSIAVLPASYFYPFPPNPIRYRSERNTDTARPHIKPESFALHYWKESWSKDW